MQQQTKQEKFKELLQLMEKYPDLPVIPMAAAVIPMVEGEIALEYEYGYWIGNWSNAILEEYIICKQHLWLGQIFFKSDSDIDEVLGKYLTDEEIENLPESEEECKEIYNSLPWTKAIVVFIDLPELDESELEETK